MDRSIFFNFFSKETVRTHLAVQRTSCAYEQICPKRSGSGRGSMFSTPFPDVPPSRQSGCCLKPRELYKLQSLIGLFSPNLWPRGSRAGEPGRQPGEELHPPRLGGEREEQNPANKEFIKQDWPPCLPPISHTSLSLLQRG